MVAPNRPATYGNHRASVPHCQPQHRVHFKVPFCLYHKKLARGILARVIPDAAPTQVSTRQQTHRVESRVMKCDLGTRQQDKCHRAYTFTVRDRGHHSLDFSQLSVRNPNHRFEGGLELRGALTSSGPLNVLSQFVCCKTRICL